MRKRPLHSGQVSDPDLCEGKAAWSSEEQGPANVMLKRANMARHGCLGHVQFFSGTGEAQVRADASKDLMQFRGGRYFMTWALNRRLVHLMDFGYYPRGLTTVEYGKCAL